MSLRKATLFGLLIAIVVWLVEWRYELPVTDRLGPIAIWVVVALFLAYWGLGSIDMWWHSRWKRASRALARGIRLQNSGNTERARRAYLKAVRLGEPLTVAVAITNLYDSSIILGDDLSKNPLLYDAVINAPEAWYLIAASRALDAGDLPHMQESIDSLQERGDPYWVSAGNLCLGAMYARNGDITKAVEHLRAAGESEDLSMSWKAWSMALEVDKDGSTVTL